MLVESLAHAHLEYSTLDYKGTSINACIFVRRLKWW
jgi:hypothetical protein